MPLPIVTENGSAYYAKNVYSLLLFSALFWLQCVTAQEVQSDVYKSISIEELVNLELSTASLIEQQAFEAPSKVQVIGKETIQKRNYRYLADVLKDLPAVRLSLYSASPDSGSSEMIVRGIRGNNKVVLMWNGQRLNHPDAQPLHITPYLYPLTGIEQIEIIYGSASALYGSDTVSMTINMVSNTGLSEFESSWRGGIDYGRYNETKGFVQYTGKHGEMRAEILLDLFQTDGVDFSGFEQFYSQYPNAPGINAEYTFYPREQREPYYEPNEEGLTARFRLEMAELSIQAYFQRLTTQTQLGWSPILYEANGNSGQYVFDQLGFYLIHRFELNSNLTMESLIDHTRNQLDPDSHWSRPNSPPFRVYSDSLEPRGIGTRTYKLNFGNRTKIEERLSWNNFDDQLHSILGLSFTTVDMMPKSANLDFPSTYNNSFSSEIGDVQKFHNLSETNWGLFYQGQYLHSDTITITFGGRFDKHSRYGHTFNPRIVFNYFDDESGWFFKGIAGTSFLAPAAFFTYDTFLVPRSSQQVPNPNLKPEETASFEFNFGKTYKKVALEASIFNMQIDNLIMQRQLKSAELLSDELGEFTFTTTHTINSGETQIDGFSVELKGQVNDHVLPYLSYTYLEGKTTDATNKGLPCDLIHAPANQVKLGVDSNWLDNRLILYAETQYIGKSKYHPDNYRFPASDNNGQQFEMDAYTLIGLGGSYQINKRTRVHFDISNVSNEKYQQPIVGQETSNWTRVAYTPGLPRQYYVGISSRF